MKLLDGYGTYLFIILGTIVMIFGAKYELPNYMELAILLYGMGGIRLRQAVSRENKNKGDSNESGK